MNRERAYVQLISKLLGVEFDAIWRRHRRLLIQKLTAWLVGGIVVLAALVGAWAVNQPVDVEVKLEEVSLHNPALPPLQDVVVTLTLDNETKTDTIHSLESASLFANIPHRFIGEEVHITTTIIDAKLQHSFLPVDTTVVLSELIVIPVRRDERVYGDVHFRLWNAEAEETVSDVEIEIAGQSVVSDAEGRYSAFVPLESQKTAYRVKSSVSLEKDTIYMPCDENNVIVIASPQPSP